MIKLLQITKSYNIYFELYLRLIEVPNIAIDILYDSQLSAIFYSTRYNKKLIAELKTTII